MLSLFFCDTYACTPSQNTLHTNPDQEIIHLVIYSFCGTSSNYQIFNPDKKRRTV